MAKTVNELSISCLIPMYNEEANVRNIIAEAEKMFSQLVSDWEIIIVESGSTDNTWKRIQEAVKGKGRIRAFHQDRKEGAGSAIRLGHSKCTKDLIFHLEADSPFEMIYFKKALPIFLENNCVIGYRVGAPERNYRWSYYNMGAMAFMRQLFHDGYNFLLRNLFGLTVKDVNFSFKIFKREDIQKLDLKSNGWFIDAEILLELKRAGVLPIEMPIPYKDRTAGKSTVSCLEPFGMLYEMMRYTSSLRKKQRTRKKNG
ncbi:MAG: glycosyltransferase family 2 protein [Candidatus Omnitrophota bacterium]